MTHDIVQTSAADTLPPFNPATFWTQFHHDTVAIKGVRLHFLEGGSGTPILLLPGWPQSWYAWRYVMPLLAKAGRSVIALAPRGSRASWFRRGPETDGERACRHRRSRSRHLDGLCLCGRMAGRREAARR